MRNRKSSPLRFRFLSLAAVLCASVGLARAAPDGPPPICTDRPAKGNSVCTVPEGDWQIETDLGNFTRAESEGVRSDIWLAPNPTLKYGLGSSTDLEVNWAPWVQIQSTGSSTISGSSDVYLRLKQRLTADGAAIGFSLVPFVKIPAAKRGIGNREVEGGIAAPIAMSLPNSFTLTLGPEVDALLDADGHGYHANLVNVVNVSRSFDKLTLVGELWAGNNFDPAGTINQYSADVAVSYLVTPVLEFDAGANFGLSKTTPDYQVYAGISTRF